MAMSGPLRDFPSEIALLVFSYLTPLDLHTSAQVSRSWRIFALQDNLWRPHCEAENLGLPERPYTLFRGRPSKKPVPMREHYWRYRALLFNWKMGRAKRRKMADHHEDVIMAVACYSESGVVMCASASRDGELKITAMHPLYPRTLMSFKPHPGEYVFCLGFNIEEIVTGSYEGVLTVWPRRWSEKGVELEPRPKHRFYHDSSVIELRSKEGYICSCTNTGKVLLWSNPVEPTFKGDIDLQGCIPVSTFTIPASTPEGSGIFVGLIGGIDFNSEIVCAGTAQPAIVVWNRGTGECLHVVRHHAELLSCVKILDNKTLVSGSEDGTAVLWNWGPDGGVFTKVHEFRGHLSGVRCLQVRHGFLVTGSYDHSIIVWNLSTGERIAHFTGHLGDVNSVDCSDDMIISASDDKSLRVWDFQPNIRFAPMVSTRTFRQWDFSREKSKWMAAIHEVLSEILEDGVDGMKVDDMYSRICLRNGFSGQRPELMRKFRKVCADGSRGADALFSMEQSVLRLR